VRCLQDSDLRGYRLRNKTIVQLLRFVDFMPTRIPAGVEMPDLLRAAAP